MNIKKTSLGLIVAIMFLSFTPFTASASTDFVAASKSNEIQRTSATELRVNEIYEICKSDLTPERKKELRKEVKAINRLTSNGGVYISGGAVILLIILLIILL